MKMKAFLIALLPGFFISTILTFVISVIWFLLFTIREDIELFLGFPVASFNKWVIGSIFIAIMLVVAFIVKSDFYKNEVE